MIQASAALRCTRQALVPFRRPLSPPTCTAALARSRPLLVRHFRTTPTRRNAAPEGPIQASAPSPPSAPPSAGPLHANVARPARRQRRRPWPRRIGRGLLLYVALPTALLYGWDRTANHSALARTGATFALGLLVAADYKLNFRPDPWMGGSVEELHARSARRLNALLRANGGLYLKIGQALAMQSAVLPPEFQRMFARMFDDAPQNAWADVARVVREDFGGRSVEEVFGVRLAGEDGEEEEEGGREGEPRKGVMERTARASASVAQVHWARLPDGREVAIKIQKREIAAQVGWDLWTFKVVSWVYSKWFDLPFYNLVPFVTERLLLETDFENEARNGERTAALVADEPRLRGRVHVPRVYHELSSRRVLTAEWIEGARLWDRDTITRPWRGGAGRGSPGCRGTPLDPPGTSTSAIEVEPPADDRPPSERGGAEAEAAAPPEAALLRKPARAWWRGARGDGGLGLPLREVMQTMVDLFSAQMFLWGWVHCDPHPGNLFVRRQPSGAAELVLLDHGLYVQMRPAFRRQYAAFWRALLELDNAAVQRIAAEWGIQGGGGEFFASATLMRPYQGGRGEFRKQLAALSATDRRKRHYEMQQQSRAMIREILADEDKWPRELLFIARNLRIVQGNNQFLGSPVNRVKITGLWASRALAEDGGRGDGGGGGRGLVDRVGGWGRHLVFRCVLLGSDAVFWWSRVRQWLGLGKGMDDDIERQMKSMAKDMGVELNHEVFEG